MTAPGPLFVDIDGVELSAEDLDVLRHPTVGGVVLFTRNFVDPQQLSALCRDIASLREPRLLIAVDHEGGRVQRFREHFTTLPAAATLGDLLASDAQQAVDLIESVGWILAAELLACGVDLSFAPVLDLRSERSSVIGARAFHSDPALVVTAANALRAGMKRAGMASVGKHFPGHGSAVGDSHNVLPVDTRTRAETEEADLRPFRELIAAGIPAIMSGHVVYCEVDSQAATFSRYWLHDVLRGELGFEGAVFSDDLSMRGAWGPGDATARCAAALGAGCDAVLVCNDRQACVQALDQLQIANPGSHWQRRAPLLASSRWDWDSLRALDETRTVRESLAPLQA